jgi:excisionase family DNA binding protein
MKDQFLLIGTHIDDLLKRIEQIIDKRLNSLSPQTQKQSEYISRKDVGKLLKVSLPTLHEYTKLGWLQSYKIGNRVLYKREEVEQSLNQVLFQKHKKGGIQ